jgi:hypothetical protein
MNLEKMKQEIDAWFNSPEGQASLEKFGEDMKQKDLFNERVETKLHNYLSTLTDGELEILVEKLATWEYKQENLLYSRGIDGNSLLFAKLCGMAERFGTKLTDQYEMFYGYGYQYRGYDFKTYFGQGSFTSLTKGEERYI